MKLRRLKFLRAFRGDRRGVASVEFAITFVVVLIALFGIFEVGLIFLTKRGIDRGVVNTARWIAVNSTTATTTTVKSQFVTAAALALGSTNANNCTVSFVAAAPTTPNATGCYVYIAPATLAVGSAVTVTATFAWAPFEKLLKLSSMTLISSVALTIQE